MSGMLSSDVIEKDHGPTEVEILYRGGKERIICTKDQTGKIHELSYVTFHDEGIKTYPSIHEIVKDGTSMGKAFRAAGVDFFRETPGGVTHSLPENFQTFFGNNLPGTIIELTALVGPNAVPYADILEVFSADVDWPAMPGELPEYVRTRLSIFDDKLQRLGRRDGPHNR